MSRRKKRPTTPQDDHTESVPSSAFIADVQALAPSVPFPATWNTVNGRSFDAPLPDGKPGEIPESWKLPPELRGKPA